MLRKTHIGKSVCFLDRAEALSSRKKKKNTQAVTNAAIIAVRRLMSARALERLASVRVVLLGVVTGGECLSRRDMVAQA